jgi:hypothetical protein
MNTKHILKNDNNKCDMVKKRRRNKILLVDDEPDVCMVYQIALQDAVMNVNHIQIQL